jgi:hypothetical protein
VTERLGPKAEKLPWVDEVGSSPRRTPQLPKIVSRADLGAKLDEVEFIIGPAEA